jgi:putative copper export protein
VDHGLGVALIVELCVVLAVVALGTWNWRRQKPRMGTEAGALALRRTARAELAVAAVVLAVTAALVSLPSPR